MQLFWLPLHKGTFLDKFGSTITKSGTNAMKQLGKGFSLDCAWANYVYSGTVAGDYKTIVMEFWLENKIVAGMAAVVLGSLTSTGFIAIGEFSGVMTDETFIMYDTIGGSKSLYIKDNIPAGYNQIIMIWNGSAYDCLLNGIQVTTYIGREQSSLALINGGDVYIGKREGSAAYFTGGFLNREIYDHSFTTLERANKYNEYLHRSYICPPKRQIGEFKTVFKGDGVRNFVDLPAGITSGTGDWEFEYIASLETTSYSIVIDAYIGGNDWFYIGYYNRDCYFKYWDGSVTKTIIKDTPYDVPTKFKVGVRSSTNEMYMIIDGVEYTEDISTISQKNFTIERFGKLNATGDFHKGIISDVKFTKAGVSYFWYKLDEKEWSVAYDSSSNNLHWTYHWEGYHTSKLIQDTYIKEDFQGNPADGQNKLPLGWTVGTGVYKTEELTTNDGVLTHLTKGTKYLQCTAAGAIGFQNDEAYGTWEFDLNKVWGNAVQYTIFIANDSLRPSVLNTYAISFDNSEVIRILKDGGTLLASADNYLKINTRYRLKITRDFSGKFTLYIKGGAFWYEWTLVDVSGGIGTNPSTDNANKTCSYIVLDYDTGDRIANITHKKWIL